MSQTTTTPTAAPTALRLPDFVLIGAMKCGTSTLHDQLAAQDGFFMCTPKEPNFFSDDPIYARGMDWYAGLFQGAAPGQLRGESSTHYTKRPTHPRTFERLRRALPEARLIYMMRHPIDRLISHYVHEWTENRIRTSLERAVAEVPDLVDYGLYGMQIEPFLEAYGPDRVLPLFLERMSARPQETLEQVARWLGHAGPLTWQDDLGERNVGADRLRKSRLRDLVVEAPLLRELRRWLVPRPLRAWVKGFWQMRQRPQLSEATLARLRERFDADLSRLSRWLGLGDELRCSTFKDVARRGPFAFRPEVSS